MTQPRPAPLPPGSQDPIALASRLQDHAASPLHSAWVDASAGSGKTKVLVDRVLNLLRRGVAPHRILCLTYTKAAAANMSIRLNRVLGEWATLPQAKLAQRLGIDADETEEISKARELFARTLDAPGGLQFLTIHGFCQSLLARFPLEAGVPVGFKVLDDRQSQQLLQEARQQLLHADDDNDLAKAVTLLLEQFDDGGFAELEKKIIGGRRLLEPVLGTGATRALERLTEIYGSDATEQDVLARFCADDAQDYKALRAATAALLEGSINEQKMGAKLAGWLAQDAAGRAQNIASYLSAFLTTENEGRKATSLVTKPYREKHPDHTELLIGHIDTALGLLEYLRLARSLATSRAINIYAAGLLERYHTLKAARQALDYDDLIARAASLVSNNRAAWVLYKLDGGIDHVLVDEGQDTNPLQWRILDNLTSNFFETVPDPEQPERTFFAVGDFKQSIYSFQGADPRAFTEAREQLAERLSRVDRRLEKVRFMVSFRSTAAVLEAVDRVFAEGGPVSTLPEYARHISTQPHVPGVVELWPPAPGYGKDDGAEDDATPFAANRQRPHPRTRTARLIAAELKRRVDSQQLLPARGRALRYGDALILVRSRGNFVTELVRACKQAGVPVSGADRMQLGEQLVVEDMLALLQFFLLPEDDLMLASVLKGPLINMSEETLFSLCHSRKPATLWQRLGQDEATRPVAAWLAALLNQADRLPPYAMLMRLLVQPCPADARSGRHALLRRLGAEAADPLDELLAAALEFEQQEAASLQRFVRWMQASETEIKREMDQAGDVVRIMTVHSAKGLEAPLVIYAGAYQTQPKRDALLIDPEGREPLLLSPGSENEPAPLLRLRDEQQRRAQEEDHRLLYVALTRAEDELIIASWLNSNMTEIPETEPRLRSWARLVGSALENTTPHHFDFTAVLGADGWEGDGWRLALGGQDVRQERHNEAAALPSVALPGWATTLPKAEPSPTKPLTPSREEDESIALSPLLGEDESRFRRGLIIHRLLQTLPELPANTRREAALRWTPPAYHGVVTEVLRVLESPDSAFLFGPQSRAEVPVSGIVGGRVLSGQIDRLAVSDDTVWIADYKTNRQQPDSTEGVDAAYLRQLAAYRAALQPIYPDKRIKALLVWTNTPAIMPIPDTLLDAHAP